MKKVINIITTLLFTSLLLGLVACSGDLHDVKPVRVDLSGGGIAGPMQKPKAWDQNTVYWDKADKAAGVYTFNFTAETDEVHWKVLGVKGDWDAIAYGNTDVPADTSYLITLNNGAGGVPDLITKGCKPGMSYRITVECDDANNVKAKVNMIAANAGFNIDRWFILGFDGHDGGGWGVNKNNTLYSPDTWDLDNGYRDYSLIYTMKGSGSTEFGIVYDASWSTKYTGANVTLGGPWVKTTNGAGNNNKFSGFGDGDKVLLMIKSFPYKMKNTNNDTFEPDPIKGTKTEPVEITDDYGNKIVDHIELDKKGKRVVVYKTKEVTVETSDPGEKEIWVKAIKLTPVTIHYTIQVEGLPEELNGQKFCARGLFGAWDYDTTKELTVSGGKLKYEGAYSNAYKPGEAQEVALEFKFGTSDWGKGIGGNMNADGGDCENVKVTVSLEKPIVKGVYKADKSTATAKGKYCCEWNVVGPTKAGEKDATIKFVVKGLAENNEAYVNGEFWGGWENGWPLASWCNDGKGPANNTKTPVKADSNGVATFGDDWDVVVLEKDLGNKTYKFKTVATSTSEWKDADKLNPSSDQAATIDLKSGKVYTITIDATKAAPGGDAGITIDEK